MQLMSEAMVSGVLEEVRDRPSTRPVPKPSADSQEARRRVRQQAIEVEAALRLSGGGMPNRKQRRAAAAFARQQAKVNP